MALPEIQNYRLWTQCGLSHPPFGDCLTPFQENVDSQGENPENRSNPEQSHAWETDLRPRHEELINSKCVELT